MFSRLGPSLPPALPKRPAPSGPSSCEFQLPVDVRSAQAVGQPLGLADRAPSGLLFPTLWFGDDASQSSRNPLLGRHPSFLLDPHLTTRSCLRNLRVTSWVGKPSAPSDTSATAPIWIQKK